MPRNGTGTYSLPSPPSPFVAGTLATASDQNTRDNDVAQALTESIARDGQTVITANLPMSGFKHTGVTAASGASSRTEYVGAGALQDGSVLWLGATGGAANAYTITAVPALSALVTGMVIRVTWHASNTGPSTLNLSSLGVKNIKVRTGGGLADPRANELRASMWSDLLYDGTQLQVIGAALQPATQAEVDAGTSAIVALTPAVFAASSALANVLNQINGGYTDVASATTTDIGAPGVASVRITGTTTITGFGTIAAATRRRLRFAGALILTHNATSLILPTGSNITTAAGDTAVAISLGSGNWVVTDYQRANGRPVTGASASVWTFPRVQFQHQLASGTNSPTYAASGWRTVSINTEVLDTDNRGAVAANVITLQPGRYKVTAEVMCFNSAGTVTARLRLRNTTAGSTIVQGVNSGSNQSAGVATLGGTFEITAATTIELQIWPTFGLTASGAMTTGESEIYTNIMFEADA